eukprot:Gregarina_sp_Pseudo_9__2068@NODE_2435_length_996_cov_131_718913_g2241_i0_p1_GENE_NODE_2435_length_996_cov_131_718913_g2241_i0NODE_2435_length_996_cov_131_718913_g2241_i0_p1_ORF_typecomplete_len230_score15_15_NODE_2435_length_996_cov_131_718913_g2241_i067756
MAHKPNSKPFWSLGAIFQLVLLSLLLGFVVFSHWVYYGCDLARSNSPFSVLKDLTAQQCPSIGLLPRTPLQLVILDWLPYSDDLAEAAYQIGCRRTLFGSPSMLCETSYAFSFLATIAEYCFYVLLLGKVIRPLVSGVWRIVLYLVILFLTTRAINQYGQRVFPVAYAEYIVGGAAVLENLIIETFLFFYSSILFLYYHVKEMGALETFPGESLYKALRESAIRLMGRL